MYNIEYSRKTVILIIFNWQYGAIIQCSNAVVAVI